MRFLDLFAGIGGFRKGLEDAGHHCVGFCEKDKYAIASYTAMHLITESQRQHLLSMDKRHRLAEILKEEYRNGEWFIDDIQSVTASIIPRADLWAFGAPCQDFSIANYRRQGLGGDRSSLVGEVFRILSEMDEEERPKWLLYENVKGMLSSNKGHDFLEILVAMDELGYDAEWQVFNSKHFGVPQNRERVYTLGHLRRLGGIQVFPLTGTDREDSVQKIERIANYRSGNGRSKIYSTSGISRALSATDDKQPISVGVEDSPQVGVIQVNDLENNHQAGRIYDPQGSAPALTDMQGGGREPRVLTTGPVAMPVLTPERVKRQNGRQVKDNNEDSFTITRRDRHGVAVVSPEMDGIPVRNATAQGYEVADIGDSVALAHMTSNTRRGRVGKKEASTIDTTDNVGVVTETGSHENIGRVWYPKQQCYISIRRLTPKECFRLQGWDDEHFERAEMVNSDAQLYKQAGNGVTVNVVRVIGEKLKETE